MIAFDNSYARLPERFFARQPPTPVPAPRLIRLNEGLAVELGLDPAWLASPEGVEFLAGNRVPDGAEPLAMAYAGHQFGSFVPQLGDGRAVLLGEVLGRDGVRRDIQLKGAGRTPFSRMGDGRAVLGPVLREYVVSEAMAALGIATTRSLAAVSSGALILRDGMKPGAVLTRVARSHVRIGTFQFFARRGDVEGVRQLADYVIARHYPEVARADSPPAALLAAVLERTAALVASWQLVGFIHGVMNTDNMSIAGETIDYGPCAFMDHFHPATVFSSIDSRGRYAWQNQPGIAHWNLARLAESLLPLLGPTDAAAVTAAEAVLDGFPACYERFWQEGLRRKLGLAHADPGDPELAADLLAVMAAQGTDFTLTFRRLCAAETDGGEATRSLFADPRDFDTWFSRWRRRLELESTDRAARAAAMQSVNPAYIPRNHRLEAVIVAAEERGDYGPFEELVTVLARPFSAEASFSDYAVPPRPEEVVQATFCGT